MNTPMRVGDRVESGAYGPGTVEGFGFCEGEGEHVRVLFDSCPTDVVTMMRHELQRVRGTTAGVIQVGHP